MKLRNLMSKITAIIMVISFACTSIPVYAEEEYVIESLESESAPGEEASEPEVVSLSVTIEEVTDYIPETAQEEITSETVIETEPEEESQDGSEPAEEIEPAIEPSFVPAPTPETAPSPEPNTSEPLDSPCEPAPLEDNGLNQNIKNDQDINSDQNINNGGVLTPEGSDYVDGTRKTYTKTIESFSTSQSSTGRYNASFVLTEIDDLTQEVKKYNYTVSGFTSQAKALEYANALVGLTNHSGNIIFRVNDSSLIDAEKKPWKYDSADPALSPGDSYDSNLCWAGSVSDMLELSGWNKLVDHDYHMIDVSNEDMLFNWFSEAFSDLAGNQIYGLNWFFNGMNDKQGYDGWAQLKDPSYASMGMLNEYCIEDLVDYKNAETVEELTNILKTLDEDEDGDRCTIGLVFGYYPIENGEYVDDGKGDKRRDGGHCVTIVGYSTDENGVPNTITIADSDSYNPGERTEYSKDNDRTSYANVYTTYPIRYYNGSWHIMNFTGADSDTIIDGLIVLKYYSDNTKDKVDHFGTHDLVNYNDYEIYNQSIYKSNFAELCESIYQGEKLTAGMMIYNHSWNWDLEESIIPYRFVVKRNGEVVRTVDYSHNSIGVNNEGANNLLAGIIMDEDSPLEPGEYTVSFIVNHDMSVTEAYYYNNESKTTLTFIVLKRVDDNGDVHYIVVPDTDNSEETSNEEYKEAVTDFIQNIIECSAVTEKSVYEKDRNKTLELVFTNGITETNINENNVETAEVIYDYSVIGDMESPNSDFGVKITSDITVTKNDYIIEKNPDGSIRIIFTNEFIRKLPKGTHYFKLKIAGKVRIFKIEVQ